MLFSGDGNLNALQALLFTVKLCVCVCGEGHTLFNTLFKAGMTVLAEVDLTISTTG